MVCGLKQDWGTLECTVLDKGVYISFEWTLYANVILWA
jgi:hypothetical protein